YFATHFYETWAFLSNATPAAARRYLELKQAYHTAAAGGAQEVASIALDRHAQTIANWWGLRNISAAFVGLPVGFVVIWIVSLLTARPSQAMYDMIDKIRRPKGEMILTEKDAFVTHR
ncbi:MAG: hypothetical protein ACREC6_01455, partial [Hyphomicrobiaceae bacterium]